MRSAELLSYPSSPPELRDGPEGLGMMMRRLHAATTLWFLPEISETIDGFIWGISSFCAWYFLVAHAALAVLMLCLFLTGEAFGFPAFLYFGCAIAVVAWRGLARLDALEDLSRNSGGDGSPSLAVQQSRHHPVRTPETRSMAEILTAWTPEEAISELESRARLDGPCLGMSYEHTVDWALAQAFRTSTTALKAAERRVRELERALKASDEALVWLDDNDANRKFRPVMTDEFNKAIESARTRTNGTEKGESDEPTRR